MHPAEWSSIWSLLESSLLSIILFVASLSVSLTVNKKLKTHDLHVHFIVIFYLGYRIKFSITSSNIKSISMRSLQNFVSSDQVSKSGKYVSIFFIRISTSTAQLYIQFILSIYLLLCIANMYKIPRGDVLFAYILLPAQYIV